MKMGIIALLLMLTAINYGSYSNAVGMSTTTTSLSTSTHSQGYRGNIEYTATVTSTEGVPTGTITYMNGSEELGTAFLSDATLNTATATITINFLTAGAHTITAVYSGDSNYMGSTSGEITQEVVQAPSTVSVSSSANPSVYGDYITFTATVSSLNEHVPTGEVAFKNGDTTLQTLSLSDVGVVTFENIENIENNLLASSGFHNITAEYLGDTNYLGSTSSVLSQYVAVDVDMSINRSSPTVVGESISFYIVVNEVSATTNTISIMDGDQIIVQDLAIVNNDYVLWTAPNLPAGLYSFTAVFSGEDTNFETATSAPIQLLILDPASLDVNQDNRVEINDIVRIIVNGTLAQKDFNHDGAFNQADIHSMLTYISTVNQIDYEY